MSATEPEAPATRWGTVAPRMENPVEIETTTPEAEAPATEARPLSHPTDLLADNLDGDTLHAWAVEMSPHNSAVLAETWETLRRSIWAHRTDGERTLQRAQRWESVARAKERTLERDRQALTEALEQIHGTTARHDMTWEHWRDWLKIAYTVGVLQGYPNDAHTLAEYMAEHVGDVAREVWREVSAEQRTEAGTWPEPVSSEEAIDRAMRRYWSPSMHHPADPRLADGWRTIWATAKSAGLCEVFDNLAEALGVPTQEFTRSGTVTVTFTGSVNIDVENVGEDIWEHINPEEVADAITRWDIDIDHIDEDDLRPDV